MPQLGVTFVDLFAGSVLAVFVLLISYMYAARPRTADPEPIQIRSLPRLPPAAVGMPYLFTFPVTGGKGDREFALEGSLPAGLAFERKTGTIYGTPAARSATQQSDAGTKASPAIRSRAPGGPQAFPFKIKVTDHGDVVEARAVLEMYPLAVPMDPEGNPLRILNEEARLPPARVGRPYEAVVAATGGVPPYSWRLGPGAPRWLGIRDGRLIGTPDAAGIVSLSVEVLYPGNTFTPPSWIDAEPQAWSGGTARHTFQLDVLPARAPIPVLPTGRVGEGYVGAMVLSHGGLSDVVEWSGLPAGVYATGAGTALAGTPTEVGTFHLGYVIRDGQDRIDEGRAELRILSPRSTFAVGGTALSAWTNEPTTLRIPHFGGEPPVQITINGPIPAGLMQEGDVLHGTPTEAALAQLRVEAVDALGAKTEGTLTIRVGPRF